jgi:hypothetical protein
MTNTPRKFGRRASFDPRSRNYPIRALVLGLAPRSYTWSCAVHLDQGSTSACTGFSVSQEAAAKPVVVQGISSAVALALYERAKQLDEWPGENYEGSSVLGAIKAGVERGWYGEYRWAFGEPDLALAIGYKGPAVLGINWYDGMMEPDAKGVLHASGQVVGGHAILCNGYSVTKKLYRVHNSWGAAWGLNGEAFITVADMAKLLGADGEACIPLIRKLGV